MNDTNLPNIEDEGINIKKYIFLILSHWWWFAIALFISLTIAYLVNRYSQKIYSANCSVIIGDQGTQIGSIENILDELSRVRNKKNKATVENEITILKSYKMARMALEELNFNVTYVAVGRRGIAESHLYKKCPFKVKYDTSETNLINYPVEITILSDSTYRMAIDDRFHINKKMYFGEKFENKSFHFTLQLRDPDNLPIQKGKKYYFQFNDINSLAKQYRQTLNVEVNDEKGAILTLSMQGYVQAQLADYLNKLSEVYLCSNLEEKNQTSESTIKFIDEQLGNIVDSLEQTGTRLQQFRTANKVIDLSREGTFLYQHMLELQSEKARYDMQRNYFNYLSEYIDKKNLNEDVVAPSVIGIQDNLLNQLVAELSKLIQQRRQLSFSANESSPQLSLINSQIVSLKASLQENLESLSETNQLEMNNLETRIRKIDTELQKLPATEKQMIDIQRKFTINDEIYTFLLQKRAEAGITRASNTSDHKILDTAQSENASIVKPKISMNYIIGLLTGTGVPFLLLLLVEFFNTKITDRKYLENNLRVPIIGNIGHNDGNTEIPVFEKPGSSLAESFRGLRTNISYILHKCDNCVIAVTSAVSGEGKTFCSVNLACILAMNNKKTLLISLDLRRPKIHRIFNRDNSKGVSTYLIEKTSYKELIQDTNIDNLKIAVSGTVPPNPSELIGSEKMKSFIEQARKDFDYIILDTPPIAIVTDALALKDLLDALIFVVRYNYSDRQVVELANTLNDKKWVKSFAVVVNDILLRGYYGYSYRYSYGYGYGYSYGYRSNYYSDEYKKKNRLFRVFKNKKL